MKSILIVTLMLICFKPFAQKVETDAKPLITLFQQIDKSIENRQTGLAQKNIEAELIRAKELLIKESLQVEEISELSTILGFTDIKDFNIFVNSFNTEVKIFQDQFSKKPIVLTDIIYQIDGLNSAKGQTYAQCCNNAFANAVICVTVSIACGPFIWLCGGGCVAYELVALNSCHQQFSK